MLNCLIVARGLPTDASIAEFPWSITADRNRADKAARLIARQSHFRETIARNGLENRDYDNRRLGTQYDWLHLIDRIVTWTVDTIHRS